MNILLDTHILLWALSDDARLSEVAKKYLLDESNTIYYSSISVWEIELKHKIRPNEICIDGKTFSIYCKKAGYLALNFTERHAMNCESLAYPENIAIHKDPFDRALVASAKTDKMVLMTHDQKIAQYKEPCILFV